MPAPIPTAQLDAVLALLRRHPEGASVDAIHRSLKPIPPRRSLQRWIALLVQQGRIAPVGAGRGRRYHIADAARSITPEAAPAIVAEPPAEFDPIRLSRAAQQTKKIIARPFIQRTPVGYDFAFLDGYRPNESAYLPSALRKKLAALGRTTGEALPAGTHLRKVMDRLLIDLSWNSSRLEGNTYSLLETQRLLEAGEAAEGKRTEETQMILNHKAAIELLAEHAGEIGFNCYTICNLHALLSENLLPEPAAGGRLRAHAVGIGGSVFHPLENPHRIEEYFDQLLATAAAIRDPFEQAFFAMVQLPYLQPFEDVNKRVSRLAANIPLVQHNLGPLSFVDVPQSDYTHAVLGVYELQRVDYLRDVFEWAYERSCARYAAVRQVLGEPDAFRLRHRERLKEIVAVAVREGLDKKAAAAFVRREAAKLPDATDRKRFAELVETELTSLHEGNFARYRLRPSEFAAWRKTWR
ncbi:MAG: Fic family protein [Verrucomicrobia bacterium]|nr:Fic family protein [Verrucomicrobiota bacterium]